MHANKYQSGLQVDFNNMGTKFGYKVILWLLISMMKHSQITQSNNFANLWNISKKLGMEFIFCMQINIKVSKNWHYRFWRKQKIRRSVMFLQYIKNCFCVLFWCKTFRYFMRVHSCLLLLVFGWLKSKIGSVFYTMTLTFDIYIYIYIYIYTKIKKPKTRCVRVYIK